ncbi:hypothetical protein [Lacipirellula parvula]|nr:hypothetical protein [Lacipirellula parvula]
MNKAILLALAFTGLLASSPVSAAPFLSIGFNPNSSVSVYLHGDSLNENFDAFRFRALPLEGQSFLNLNSGLIAGAARPAGSPFTYRNRLLDYDPLDDPNGKGWVVINPITTSSEVSFAGGTLTGKISTAGEPQGKLFLANLVPSATGFGVARLDISLFNAGQLVFTTLPEPSSLFLCAGVFVGTIMSRRRPRFFNERTSGTSR